MFYFYFFEKNYFIFNYFINSDYLNNNFILFYKFLQYFTKSFIVSKGFKDNNILYNNTVLYKKNSKLNYILEKDLKSICGLFIRVNIACGINKALSSVKNNRSFLTLGSLYSIGAIRSIYLNTTNIYMLLRGTISIFFFAGISLSKFLIFSGDTLSLKYKAVNYYCCYSNTTCVLDFNMITSIIKMNEYLTDCFLAKKLNFDFFFMFNSCNGVALLDAISHYNAFIFGVSDILDQSYYFDIVIPIIANTEDIQFFFLNLVIFCLKSAVTEIISLQKNNLNSYMKFFKNITL